MMLVTDIIIAAILVFALYSGFKQGFILVGLEIISFMTATLLAVAGYHLLGAGFKALSNTSTALSNIVAFVIIWAFSEMACSLIIHFGFLKRFSYHRNLSRGPRIGGSILNLVKAGVLTALALLIYAGLPISNSFKQPVTASFAGRTLIAATGKLRAQLATGLGHDLNETFSAFTITSIAQNDERIDLGYTTKLVSVDAKDEAAMLVLLNYERTTRGLPPLTMNPQAREVTRVYSADMFARGFFAHVDPDGHNPFDRMRTGGVKFDSAGENLALAPNLAQAHDGLMKSPGHKANILSVNYKTVGIGIIDGGPYGIMVTQDFTD